MDIIEVLTDDEFFGMFRKRKWNAVLFVPAFCRNVISGKEISGSNDRSYGWGLNEYIDAVQEDQAGVKVVATVDDKEIVGLLREGLGLNAELTVNKRKVKQYSAKVSGVGGGGGGKKKNFPNHKDLSQYPTEERSPTRN